MNGTSCAGDVSAKSLHSSHTRASYSARARRCSTPYCDARVASERHGCSDGHPGAPGAPSEWRTRRTGLGGVASTGAAGRAGGAEAGVRRPSGEGAADPNSASCRSRACALASWWSRRCPTRTE